MLHTKLADKMNGNPGPSPFPPLEERAGERRPLFAIVPKFIDPAAAG
jgi:hypothetical protein